MKKEYHLYKVQWATDRPSKSYVFGVTRTNDTVTLTEVFTFVVVNGKEIAHRLNINDIMQDIAKAEKGNFPEYIIEEVREQLDEEEKEYNKQQIHQSNYSHTGLIMGSEAANNNFPNVLDFGSIDEYLNKTKNT